MTLARLTEVEYEIFYELTSIAPSLDDGEAATIAVASTRNFVPVIDEKRGRARALAKARAAGWSLDIFRHPSVLSTLGDQSAIDALYLALRDGRMRIPPESADSVIGIIGIERSRDCTCLPGYRDRFAGVPNRSIDVEATAAADLEAGE